MQCNVFEGSHMLVHISALQYVGLAAGQRLPSSKLKLSSCCSEKPALHASGASPLLFRLMRTESACLVKCFLQCSQSHSWKSLTKSSPNQSQANKHFHNNFRCDRCPEFITIFDKKMEGYIHRSAKYYCLAGKRSHSSFLK